MTWRCVRCDETFTSWAAAERHTDQNPGHTRLELVLEGRTDGD